MADNRISNVILVCVKCGQRYQAIAGPSKPRRCLCGGMLYRQKKTESGKL
jgi:hypothetical protein